MARSIWKGSIAFGLVNIPVSLTAAESRPDVQLHMVDSKNHARIRYERVNADTRAEVPWDRLVKGHEPEFVWSVWQEILAFPQRLGLACLFVQDGSLALQAAFRLGGHGVGLIGRLGGLQVFSWPGVWSSWHCPACLSRSCSPFQNLSWPMILGCMDWGRKSLISLYSGCKNACHPQVCEELRVGESVHHWAFDLTQKQFDTGLFQMATESRQRLESARIDKIDRVADEHEMSQAWILGGSTEHKMFIEY